MRGVEEPAVIKTEGALRRWRSGEEFTCQSGGHGFDAWSQKVPHAPEQPSLCTASTEPMLPNY